MCMTGILREHWQCMHKLTLNTAAQLCMMMMCTCQMLRRISQYTPQTLTQQLNAFNSSSIRPASVVSNHPHTPPCVQVLTVTSSGAASAPAAKPKKGTVAKSSSSSSAGAVSISLSYDDVADHALQVSRMLPGGLSVLGLYLFAPDSGFSSATSALCKALCSISADLAALSGPTAAAAAATPEQQQPQQELLLLHVDSASRKFTMKSCLASSSDHAAAASLKPCELKFGPSVASLVCLRSHHTFDLSLPATDSKAQLQQLLQQAIAQESARVMAGTAVISGAVPSSSTQPLADLLPASGAGVPGVLSFQLLRLCAARSARC